MNAIPIPGSKFYREFCDSCREPIRVPFDRVGKGEKCSQCSGECRRNKAASKDEYSPWQENAIRAMEDA